MIVLDVETTGLDPVRCGLISITALDFDKPDNLFHMECRIAEDILCEWGAMTLHGMTREELITRNCPTEVELLRALAGWLEGIEDQTIAGENPFFDVQFIREASKRDGVTIEIGRRTVDIHTLSYVLHMLLGVKPPMTGRHSGLSLGVTAEMLGLHQGEAPHTSHGDVILSYRTLRKIIDKLNAGMT